jgi:adenylosuccinate lyase
MGRQEAHKLTRDAAMAAREKGVHLRDVLAEDHTVMKLLTAKELDKALDPASYTGSASKIVDSVVKKIR